MKIHIPFILALFLMLNGIFSRAQLVTIPDANFVSFLQTNYPACITGDQLDTQCPEILAEDSLDVSYKNISDFTGLEYFVSLTWLDCQINSISTLPALPSGLTMLVCDNNNLTSLPALPAGLTWLSCGYNQLTSLPSLPAGLEILSCPDNNLNSLPALPASLTELVFFSNNISVLPVLPSGLLTFVCHYNQLTTLPSLPTGLVNLGCSYNLLSVLPSLPNSLTVLECAGNQLTFLPPLPQTSVLLDCSDNLLLGLPNLPAGIEYLYCDNNPDLSCLPILPAGLVSTSFGMILTLDIVGTQVTCTPNIPPLIMTSSLPLCLDGDVVNNPNGCDNNALISGIIYTDTSGNCSLDNAESAGAGVKILLLDDIADTVGVAYTAASGEFNFFYTDYGDYTLVVDTLNKPYDIQCLYPGADTSFSLVMDSIIHADFALNCPQLADAGVASVLTDGIVFPGQTYALRIFAGDLVNWYLSGCIPATMNGTVEIVVNGSADYIGPGPNAIIPGSVSGNTFNYSIADFSLVDVDSAFSLMFQTPTTATLGDSICVDVTINTGITDLYPANNTYHFCYQILNSYDPNIKEVYPAIAEPGYDDWLTYTIHFQNTGNAPAFNIKLTDTLSALVNPYSFELMAYSHPVGIELSGNNATFKFDNIMLPDSASDPSGSIGFIQYRVKPLSNLPEGTEIYNKAYIYFDYNAPIITNTATTILEVDESGLDENETGSLSIFPNPGKGLFMIQAPTNLSSDNTVLSVYTLTGELIHEEQIQLSQQVKLDLSNQKAGVYFVRWNNGSEIISAKIINY